MAKGKVLIIDDEQAICRVLSKILTAHDYETRYKLLGKLGVEALSQEKFDAVILDVFIPDLDGLSVLQRIREKNQVIPVIIITAQPTDETISLATARGAFDFIVKPFEAVNILAVVDKAVAYSRKGFLRDKNF